MEIRRALQGKPVVGITISAFLVLVAALLIAKEYWPEKKADLAQAYLTDDDGKTWYVGSAYSVPPVDHDGKTAVFAEIYTYDGGNKQFCAYLQKYTPDAKKRLGESIAEAVKDGKSPGAAALFQDHWFMQTAVMVKRPGAPDAQWVPQNDPAAIDVMSIHSPDGSAVDQAFVY